MPYLRFAAMVILMLWNLAAQGQSACSVAGYSVVFINGVFNDHDQAVETVRHLQGAYGKSSEKGKPIQWLLAENPSHSFKDITDAISQKAAETGVGWNAVEAIYLMIPISDSVAKLVPAALSAKLQQDAAAYLADQMNKDRIAAEAFNGSDPDLQLINNKIASIPANQGIVLIGHSQGTLYANLAYDHAIDKAVSATARDPQSILVTGFAAAAASIHGGLPRIHPGLSGAYVTSDTDLVIAAVRSVVPTLASNVPGPIPPLPIPDYRATLNWFEDTSAGHSAVAIYLNADNQALRKAIVDNLQAALDGLQVPVATEAACTFDMTVQGSADGWVVPPTATLGSFVQTTKFAFEVSGSPGNTCGDGERGGPIWSSVVPVEATFFAASQSIGAPYLSNRFINYKPCSSFLALLSVPDPAGKQPPRTRYWANLTGRSQQFSQFGTSDWEFQLRYDSGDPWTMVGAQCSGGSVPPFGNFVKAFDAVCTGVLDAPAASFP